MRPLLPARAAAVLATLADDAAGRRRFERQLAARARRAEAAQRNRPRASVPGGRRRGNPEHGVYVGSKLHLHGKGALLRLDGRRMLAQFDDTDTGLGYGWHRFPRNAFRIDRRTAAQS